MTGSKLKSHVVKGHFKKITDSEMQNGREWQETEEGT